MSEMAVTEAVKRVTEQLSMISAMKPHPTMKGKRLADWLEEQRQDVSSLACLLRVVEAVGRCESLAKYEGFKCLSCGAFSNTGDVAHASNCLELIRLELSKVPHG